MPANGVGRYAELHGDFAGVTTWNLTFGYLWDQDLAVMGAPVLSLRDGGFEECIWMVEFPAAGTIWPTIRPSLDGPPTVDIQAPNTAQHSMAGEQGDE
jgi:hypothetical protein